MLSEIDHIAAEMGATHVVRFVEAHLGGTVVAIERLFEQGFFGGVYGRLRDVIEGPDGALYFCTSNRDGRGTPAVDDDRVLRIVPAGG